jgi:hypothetical protein
MVPILEIPWVNPYPCYSLNTATNETIATNKKTLDEQCSLGESVINENAVDEQGSFDESAIESTVIQRALILVQQAMSLMSTCD